MKKLSVLLWVSLWGLGIIADVSVAKPNDRGNFYGFGEMETLKLQWNLNTPLVVDLNRDGLNDLIVVNNQKARIELLLQKKDFRPGQFTPINLEAEDINDRFGKENHWRFQRESYPLDLSVSSLEVADLNQDGFADMVYYTKEGLFLVYQKPTLPTEDSLTLPEWEAPKKIKITDGLKKTKALTVGDLNNDGRLDLALLRENGVNLIWQQADGQFARPIKYPSTARQMRLVMIADMNGDGLNDLVMTNSQQKYPIRIRLQDSSGQLGPEQRYDMPSPWMVKLDKMGDSPQNQIASISRQNGRVLISNWTNQELSEKFPVHYYPLEETSAAKNRDVVAVDLDQDQLLDVVISEPGQAEFLLYKSQPGLGLQSPQRFPGFKDMQKICVGQLGDFSKPSLVVFSRKEELVGISEWKNGRLTFPAIVDISGEPQAIELADINHDNHLDLVYVGKKSKESDDYFLGSILNLGTDDQVAGEPVDLPQLQDSPLGIRVGDIDHDGRRDILVLKSYGPLLLLRQKEAGIFTAQEQTGINSGLVNNVFPNTLSLVKLNGQDETVLLLAQKNFTRSIYFDNHKGWAVLDQYPAIKSNSHITAATAGQFENDDIQIITYDHAHEQVALLNQQEDGTYRATEEIEVGPVNAKRIILGHFDSSQTQSLLLVGSNKLILVPVSRGKNTLQEIASFESQEKKTEYTSLAIGDINSDQVADILLCDRGRHHVEILTFDGQAKLTSAYTFKVFEAPQGSEDSNSKQYQPKNITLGDVTNDGLADLIITVHDRIIIYPQDSGTAPSL